MTEEAKKLALEYLQKLLVGLEQGIDFAKEQLPLVLQEIIAYGRIYHTLAVALGIVLIFILLGVYLGVFKMMRGIKDGADRGMARIVASVAYGMLNIPMCTLISNNFSPMLKSWVAPRLYLIEYLHNLTK